MSERIKALLSVAAGEQAQGDQEWHAESTRRLYFGHPTDIDAAGMVDVNSKDGRDPTHVRLELWVSPEIACEVIAHVTGREPLAARALANAEVRRREADRSVEEIPNVAHGDGLDVPASVLRIEHADDERSESLTAEINATGGLAFGTEEDELEELARLQERDRKRAARREALNAEELAARLAKEREEDIAALAEEQKVDDRGPTIHPALLCEHANECPQMCPCEDEGCYCKTRTCKGAA